jgi:Fe-S oxidoreductase
LSPKLVIMDLRDHLFAKAPYIIGGKTHELEGLDMETVKEEGHHVPESGFGRVPGSGPEQAVRPLVGTAEGGVIDPDVLWSCTTCGACVEQCPVDIEHIDHIVDMRRYQVLMESEFPSELGVLFKNLENKGNPWGQNAKERLNWIDEVDFDVPVHGKDVELRRLRVPVLGRLRRRLRGPRQEDHRRGRAAVGGRGQVPGARRRRDLHRRLARRAGNEFLFQQLAAQNVETINDLFEGVERSTARSSSPARTASTRSAASTRRSAATTPCCTTPSCSTGWSATRSWSRSTRWNSQRHLPRPVLPGPAQQGLRRAA